ncbi:hypothetical protein CHARACLAT_014848 [Characodon lateralis]|uniref:Secreted protein n=1 Tax=Characodon lateralis TaxID=208331 RepID=A0ABU7F5D2_9TELE|nr:hypothetical protein [Characodon lateralis]
MVKQRRVRAHPCCAAVSPLCCRRGSWKQRRGYCGCALFVNRRGSWCAVQAWFAHFFQMAASAGTCCTQDTQFRSTG